MQRIWAALGNQKSTKSFRLRFFVWLFPTSTTTKHGFIPLVLTSIFPLRPFPHACSHVDQTNVISCSSMRLCMCNCHVGDHELTNKFLFDVRSQPFRHSRVSALPGVLRGCTPDSPFTPMHQTADTPSARRPKTFTRQQVARCMRFREWLTSLLGIADPSRYRLYFV